METSDINKVRGKLLFWKTINESGLKDNYLSRANDLGKAFEDQIGVAAFEGLYPAKRFAEAVLEVATWDYEVAGFDFGTDQVTKYFNENLKNNQPTTIKSSSYIPNGEKIDGVWGKEVAAESDQFEKELRANAEQADIDLLEEFSFEDLTIEGLRKTGLIDQNFNPSNQSLPNIQSEQIKLGKIFFSDDGSIDSVECPTCGKRDCFVISIDKYGCFICDSEFKVPMEMSDNL